MSKFSQLIDEVADQKNHTLSDVLLKAKVLAHELKSRNLRQWVNSELDGYKDKSKPPPDYRTTNCVVRGNFDGPFHSGFKNVHISTGNLEPSIREILNSHTWWGPIAHIEDLLGQTSDGNEIGMNMDLRMVNYLRHHGTRIDGFLLNEVIQLIPRANLAGLLASVRSRLLDFLLELRDKYPELDRNDDVAKRISETEIDEVLGSKVYRNCNVFEGNNMRDSYQAGQVGAMGPGAKAENFVQILRQAIGDRSLADLANDLDRLREAMLSESKTADQDEAVAAVAEAEAAARKGDAKGVLSYLKVAGKWAWDVATKIGTAIAVKAIEKSMDLQSVIDGSAATQSLPPTT